MKKNAVRCLFMFFLLLIPICFWGQTRVMKGSSKKTASYFELGNVVKINTVSLPFSNLSFTYERSLRNRFGASMGVGYKYRGETLKLLQNDSKTIRIEGGQIRGISLTPEIRYYLQSCDQRLPAGFYGGIYGRFTSFNSSLKLEYNPDNYQSSDIVGDFNIKEFGYGLMLGYQLPVIKGFVVDFQFFGPRYSFMTLKGVFETNVSDDFKDALENYVNTVIERFIDQYNFELKYVDSHTVKARFRIPNYRFGISIGYAF